MLWPLSMAHAVPFAATSICPLSSIRGQLSCSFLCWHLGVGGAMHLLWSTVTCCRLLLGQNFLTQTSRHQAKSLGLQLALSQRLPPTSPTPRPGSYIFSWEPGRESAPGQNPRSKSEAFTRGGCRGQGVGQVWVWGAARGGRGGGRGTGRQKGLTLQLHSPPSEPQFGSLASKR